MWVAAEAVDDVFVSAFVAESFFVAKRCEEAEGLDVYIGRLTMHVGQEKECALSGFQII